MIRGVHGEKLFATLQSNKLPEGDKKKIEEALDIYEKWISQLSEVDADNIKELVDKMVFILNEYKIFIDVDLIFDSENDFLYRQKGQLKLDNSVVEEFLPILITKCIDKKYGSVNNFVYPSAVIKN